MTLELPRGSEGQSETTEELYRRWIDALYSRRYSQTVGSLRDEHGYCCLGVVDEVAFGAEWTWDDSVVIFHDDHHCNGALSDERARRLGLHGPVTEDDLSRVPSKYLETHVDDLCWDTSRQDLLQVLNDGGMPFEEIARFLEDGQWWKNDEEEETHG